MAYQRGVKDGLLISFLCSTVLVLVFVLVLATTVHFSLGRAQHALREPALIMGVVFAQALRKDAYRHMQLAEGVCE